MSHHLRDIYVQAVDHGNRRQGARDPEQRLAAASGLEKVDRDDSDSIKHVERDAENDQQLQPVQLLRHLRGFIVSVGTEQKRVAVQEDVGNKVYGQQYAGKPVQTKRWLPLVPVEKKIF
jgi:hypothetical protein